MHTSLELSKLITRITKEKNVTIDGILRKCGLKSSLISNMKAGSMPAADKLAIIADYLNTTIGYLLGKTDDPSLPGSADEGPEVKYIRRNYNLMSQPERDKMMKVLGASFDDYEWEDAAPPPVRPRIPDTFAAHMTDDNWTDENDAIVAEIKAVAAAKQKREMNN
jgi:transcriptional regulator with XRE-family HTH domain